MSMASKSDKARRRLSLFAQADVLEATKNLLRSYHNETDALSELVQNSINNLLLYKISNPELLVKYESSHYKLTVQDNGTGMTEDEMRYFALGTSGTRNLDNSLGLLAMAQHSY